MFWNIKGWKIKEKKRIFWFVEIVGDKDQTVKEKNRVSTLPKVSSSSVISLSREAQCKFLARIQFNYPQKAEHFIFFSLNSLSFFQLKDPKDWNFHPFSKDPFKASQSRKGLFQHSDKNEYGGCEEDVSEGEAGGEEDQEEAETDYVSVWSMELRFELWRWRKSSS